MGLSIVTVLLVDALFGLPYWLSSGAIGFFLGAGLQRWAIIARLGNRLRDLERQGKSW